MTTIDEYDRRYRAKTGDTPTAPDGFIRTYLPERGWCYWRSDPAARLFYIWSVSGDGHFWHDWARALATAADYRAICTICTRSIRPYIRFWHWRIERTETQRGKHRFHCRTADNRPVLITHKHTDRDGSDAYWVTEYLTTDAHPTCTDAPTASTETVATALTASTETVATDPSDPRPKSNLKGMISHG